MDEMWLNLILALIGEQTFEDTDNDLVCGAVLSSRAKGTSKLALWMKTTSKDPVARYPPFSLAGEAIFLRSLSKIIHITSYY